LLLHAKILQASVPVDLGVEFTFVQNIAHATGPTPIGHHTDLRGFHSRVTAPPVVGKVVDIDQLFTELPVFTTLGGRHSLRHCLQKHHRTHRNVAALRRGTSLTHSSWWHSSPEFALAHLADLLVCIDGDVAGSDGGNRAVKVFSEFVAPNPCELCCQSSRLLRW
jgi:hypothetical protein